MSQVIAITVINSSDLLAAPAWLQKEVEERLPAHGAAWEINVYSSVAEDRRITQHLDLMVGDTCYSTGEHPRFIRHLSKGSLAVIARATLLAEGERGWYPPVLGFDLLEQGVDEDVAWLIGVDLALLRELDKLEPVLATRLAWLEERMPDCWEVWRGYREQALRAVALL